MHLVKNMLLYCIHKFLTHRNCQNLNLGFFRKFRKFQPRYSYKIYSDKKACIVKQYPCVICRNYFHNSHKNMKKFCIRYL